MTKVNEWSLDSFQQNGFALLKAAVSHRELTELLESIEGVRRLRTKSTTAAGVRHLLTRSDVVRQFAKSSQILGLAKSVIGKKARPVKAILFDKTPEANWFVTWHQDLTIAVKQRIDISGFTAWSIKDGTQHVQPPVTVLEKMVSLRVHLDKCMEENGAIKFIPQSHTHGILSSSEIADWRDQHKFVSCEAQSGDLIMMRPLILHSSSPSKTPDHRRVLHIEYSAEDLPNGLEWAEASGLDSVELLMAIEEEFGLEFPNEHAERITTVGEMYEYLKQRLGATPAEDCLSQKLFYKFRRALIENFQVTRNTISPDTKMTDLLPVEEIESGWPFLQLFIDLDTPPFKVANEIFGFKLSDRMFTVREMISALISLNREKLFQDRPNEQVVWERMVNVIVSQLNVNRQDVYPAASFTRDLGVC